MFRQVKLPDDVSGKLFLHSMPGAFEPWDEFLEGAQQANLSALISLTLSEEIRKSPRYQSAILNHELPCEKWDMPFPNFSVPGDLVRFMQSLTDAAKALREGKNLLVHCMYGIGRTGTFAACLLHEFGLNPTDAATRVQAAGSSPETSAQVEWVAWHGKLKSS